MNGFVEAAFGVVGVFVVFGLIWLVSRWFTRRRDAVELEERRRLLAQRRERGEKPYARER